jgi:hypothetical protein
MNTTILSPLRKFENNPANLHEALQLFDSLPAVTIAKMSGRWKGSAFETGHPMDGMLERFGWYGKDFFDSENVHPLLFTDSHNQIFPFSPGIIPFDFVLHHLPLFNNNLIGKIFRFINRLGRTKKPGARLRMTEYRGVVSATMIYDKHAINDIFRQVDDNTFLGAMDTRRNNPFFFILSRIDK